MATRRVPADYPTIQAALDAARPGDLITIAEGYDGATRELSVTVDNLTIDAPASVTGISLNVTSSVKNITLTGLSPIELRDHVHVKGMHIIANAGANNIVTFFGGDTIFAGAGNDTISLRAPSSDLLPGIVNGGMGVDTVFASDLLDYKFTEVETLKFTDLYATAEQLSAFTNFASNHGDGWFYVQLRGNGGTVDFTNMVEDTGTLWLQYAYGATAGFNVTGWNGSDIMRGSDFNDTLSGGGGNDSVVGGAGFDILSGGAGDDLIRGNGDDIASYADATAGVVVSLAILGRQYTGTSTGNDDLSGILDLIGSELGDRLTGNKKGNLLQGGGGEDTLAGGNGNDRLAGGDGNDDLWGESGSDTLAGGVGADEHIGGAGIDYAAYNDADWGNLLISLDNPTLNTGVAAGDTYVSIEGVIGGAGNDTIYGTARTDYLFGGSGNDQLFGGSGNDRLDGGDGADGLYGGAGADQHVGGFGAGVDYARYDDAKWGDLVISLIVPSSNTGVAAGDTYVSIEGIIGGRGNDTIFGDAARNVLQGGNGNDIIDGLDGSDVLAGQAGADRFSFSTALGATNIDTINGFEHGIDEIQLSRAIFKGVGPALDASEFGTVPGAGKLIVYNQATGELSFDAGGAGAGADAVVFAIVANKVALDIHDFVMIA